MSTQGRMQTRAVSTPSEPTAATATPAPTPTVATVGAEADTGGVEVNASGTITAVTATPDGDTPATTVLPTPHVPRLQSVAVRPPHSQQPAVTLPTNLPPRQVPASVITPLAPQTQQSEAARRQEQAVMEHHARLRDRVTQDLLRTRDTVTRPLTTGTAVTGRVGLEDLRAHARPVSPHASSSRDSADETQLLGVYGKRAREREPLPRRVRPLGDNDTGRPHRDSDSSPPRRGRVRSHPRRTSPPGRTVQHRSHSRVDRLQQSGRLSPGDLDLRGYEDLGMPPPVPPQGFHPDEPVQVMIANNDALVTAIRTALSGEINVQIAALRAEFAPRLLQPAQSVPPLAPAHALPGAIPAPLLMAPPVHDQILPEAPPIPLPVPGVSITHPLPHTKMLMVTHATHTHVPHTQNLPIFPQTLSLHHNLNARKVTLHNTR